MNLGRAGAVLAFAGMLVAVLALAATAAPRKSPDGKVTKASGRCGSCHPDERVAFEKSRHAGEEVHCVSCHGGNDQTFDEAAAHSGNGWRGKITRAQDPGVCASCHADEQKMQPYDLPVDQYDQYQTSGHGKALAKGDGKVAVCSDCHGSHEVLSAHDPASRTYVTNIPRTCGTCHGDSTLVRERQMKDAYHDYLGSVHAKSLFEKGNVKAPTCVSCHGVHGAMPSDIRNVNKVCGRCHTAERRYFLAGPHAGALAAKNMAECSSCHGEHGIAPSETARLATSCVKCHEKGSKDEVLGAALLADYTAADDEIRAAEALVARADAVPLRTEDYKSRIEEARTYLREALTASHAVNSESMSGYTARAKSVGEEISTELESKLQNILVEKVFLLVFWFYVIVTIGIIRRFRDADAAVVK
ncbi:MAG: cytochrome c3 family protein [Candidatus Eisenbacteria bacterium]